MIPEIQRFREKYPGYDDLDDSMLASKLAAKFPEYADLPDKVKARGAPRASAATAEDPSFFQRRVVEPVKSGLESAGRVAMGIYKSLDPTQAESALEAGLAPVMAGTAPVIVGGELAGETARKATEPLGPEISAAMGTAANLAAGYLIPGGGAVRSRVRPVVKTPPVGKVAKEAAEDLGTEVETAVAPTVRPKSSASELLDLAAETQRAKSPRVSEASSTLRAAQETAVLGESEEAAAQRLFRQAQERRVVSPIEEGLERTVQEVASEPRVGLPKQVGKAVIEAPVRQEVEEAKTLLQGAADPGSEFGRFKALYSGTLEESGATISRFGETGQRLTQTLRAVRDDAEREAGTAVADLNKNLSRLSQQEKANLVDVLDKGAAPISRNVAEIAVRERSKLNAIADRATAAGLEIRNPATGEKVPFTPRENFFPHMGKQSLEEIARDPKARAKAVETIGKQEGISLDEAGRIFDAMVKQSKGRYGHLEVARLYDIGEYDKNPLTALSNYYSRALRRLQEAEKLGANNEQAYEAAELIGQQFGDRARDFSKTLIDRMTGRETLGLGGKIATDIGGTVRGFEAATKLGQAVIANSSQTALTAVVAGVKNAARGIRAAMTAEGQEFALKSGATLSSALHDFLREAAGVGGRSLGSRAGEAVLRRTGFMAVERANRAVAANAGKFFAQDAFEKVLSAPKSRRGIRLSVELRRMGVDVESALKRGDLSEVDLLKAGRSIVERTQFKTEAVDLPLFWSSPSGRIFTQFKTFAFRSGKLLKDDVLKPATEYFRTGGRRGSLGPFVRAATILPIAGEGIADLRAAIRGKERPDDLLVRIVDDYAAVGTFGLFMDTWRAAAFGKAGVIGLIVGPAVSDVAEIGSGTIQALQGKPKTLGKFATRNIPVLGPSIAGEIFPRKESLRPLLRERIDRGDLGR